MPSVAALAGAALRLAAPAGARSLSTTPAAQEALKFAVVGSGPAGFYTADRLLKRFADAQVDILEALPVPFGLVRFGVAPDHQDTKNVTNQFTEIARDPRVAFIGNVRVGAPAPAAAAVALPELRALYSAVVLACGAESDRRLGVPGEDLPGVFPARRFVQWYNGHPSAAGLPLPPLDSVTSVAVCGLGNVALDIARVLLQPANRLAASDAAAAAVAALRGSAVREVHLLGRRGPAQAAFTPKELRELVSMEGVALKIHPEGCLAALGPACAAELKTSRINRRVVEVLTKAAAEGNPGDRTLHLHFLRSPAEFLEESGGGGGVGAVRLEAMELRPGASPGASQRAVGTGQYEDLPAQLVLESIGYRSEAVAGTPFDPRSGTVPNALGQVIDPEAGGAPVPGLFVCGWLKRGPSGIIGTNLIDAEQTVDTLARAAAEGDFSGGQKEGREGLQALLAARGVEAVDFAGWEAIDAAERAAGAAAGKPREKVTNVAQMLTIARSQSS